MECRSEALRVRLHGPLHDRTRSSGLRDPRDQGRVAGRSGSPAPGGLIRRRRFFCCKFDRAFILKAMPKMRAVQVPRPKGPFEMVERDVPDPGPGAVRVRVEACGICHSDSLTKEGVWPGIEYPRVPGHEIAGTVDAAGAGVKGWTEGQRVGI